MRPYTAEFFKFLVNLGSFIEPEIPFSPFFSLLNSSGETDFNWLHFLQIFLINLWAIAMFKAGAILTGLAPKEINLVIVPAA